MLLLMIVIFFFNDTATTEIYTLSLHDALPISSQMCDRMSKPSSRARCWPTCCIAALRSAVCISRDRKSTRLNSSHLVISYAVFCLKKKKYKKAREPYSNKECIYIYNRYITYSL